MSELDKAVDTKEVALPPLGLYKKILKVMEEVSIVKKNGRVSFKNTNYNYQKEEDITAAIREARMKYGLLMLPVGCEVVNTTATNVEIIMTYRLIDAETHDCVIIEMGGEGQDNGDKKMYKAETGAFKYAQKQAFALTSDEADPDAIPSPEVAGTTPDAPSDYLDTVFTFGVHKGKTIRDLAKENPGYLKYISNKQGNMQAVCQRAVSELKL